MACTIGCNRYLLIAHLRKEIEIAAHYVFGFVKDEIIIKNFVYYRFWRKYSMLYALCVADAICDVFVFLCDVFVFFFHKFLLLLNENIFFIHGFFLLFNHLLLFSRYVQGTENKSCKH